MSEPRITINGQHLSDAQSMTLRVAAHHFESVVCEPETKVLLGYVADAYRDRLREILSIIAMGA